MPKVICHEHCPKPGGSGWLLLLAVIVALALAAYGTARAASHLIERLIPWASGAVIALIASGWLGYAAVAALREHRRRAARAAAISQEPPGPSAPLRVPRQRDTGRR